MKQWVVIAGLLCGAAAAQGVPGAAQKAFNEGRQYEQRKQLTSAQDSFRASLKVAGGNCLPCFDALFKVQMEMETFKDAASTAVQMAKASSDGQTRGEADKREAEAYMALYYAEKEGRGAIAKDPKKANGALADAEGALKRGMADDPASEPLRMLHGRVLAMLQRNEEASREFEACAVMPGVSEAECARAKHYAKDVALARSEAAPAFSIRTIDGKIVTLDSLRGKVVMLDFWATWCKYCERDSDYVQSIEEVFEDKPFVLLEVSGDENDGAWRQWSDAHRLRGVQIRDEKSEMSALFHVGGFPTYIIIDQEGTIRQRETGAQGDLKGTVRKLLADQSAPAPEDRKPLPKGGQ